MSQFEDDEEEEEELPRRKRSPYPPYLYDTFTAAFRATPNLVHTGQQTVRDEDTLGTLDLCWCGEPWDHDWPGKASGRKHPRGATMPETAMLDRRNLRAYHSTIQDFILHEVRINGLKYKTRNNSILLYPPDGTTAVTIYARNTDSQLRSLTQWHQKHVAPAIHPEEQQKQAIESKVRELAATVNDPVEHPAKQNPFDAEPKPAPKPAPPPEPEPIKTEPEKNEDRTLDNLNQFPIDYKRAPNHYGAPRGWDWHIGEGGDPVSGVATDGTRWVCVYCIGTDHPYDALNARGIGGHRRYYHSESSAAFIEAREASKKERNRQFTPEERAQSIVARQNRRKRDRDLRNAIDVMCRAINYYPKDPNAPDDNQVMTQGIVDTYSEAVASLTAERDEAVKRAEEAEARLALIREAYSA